jgi:hypothetical protein
MRRTRKREGERMRRTRKRESGKDEALASGKGENEAHSQAGEVGKDKTHPQAGEGKR